MWRSRLAWRGAANAVAAIVLVATSTAGAAEQLEHRSIVNENGEVQDCLQLKAVPLATLVAEVNLHNTSQLLIVDPSIERLSMGGVICPTRLAMLLRAFRGVGVNVSGDTGDLSRKRLIRLSGSKAMTEQLLRGRAGEGREGEKGK